VPGSAILFVGGIKLEGPRGTRVVAWKFATEPRRRLPREAQIVVGIGSAEDALKGEAARTAIGADLLTGSLEESVVRCVEQAIRIAEPSICYPTNGSS
jgi:hypothetical protein